MLTDNGTIGQTATHTVVTTDLAAHVFTIFPFLPRVILNRWLSALGTAGFPVLILICSFPGTGKEDRSQSQHQIPMSLDLISKSQETRRFPEGRGGGQTPFLPVPGAHSPALHTT